MLSREHKAALKALSAWMREAGLHVRIDAAGTLIGRREGTSRNAKTLILGSHVDTVENGGRFDGCLGIVLAVEVMAELVRLGKELPFSVEVHAFASSVGQRFPIRYFGAYAATGTISDDFLAMTDRNGTTLRAALSSFGGDPDRLADAAYASNDVLAYLEVHAEQGNVLELEKAPVGIVSAIAGSSRYAISVKGRSSHAASQSQGYRRDAVAAAAEMILTIERISRDTPGLFITIGSLVSRGGAPQMSPQEVVLSLDVRSAVNRTRQRGCQDIERELKAIARRREASVSFSLLHDDSGVNCDQRLIRLLTGAAEALRLQSAVLPSGSRQDGVVFGNMCPIGMVLVRSEGGIGQRPEENVSLPDIEAAARVLMLALETMAVNGRTLT